MKVCYPNNSNNRYNISANNSNSKNNDHNQVKIVYSNQYININTLLRFNRIALVKRHN